jgi:L-asparaginase
VADVHLLKLAAGSDDFLINCLVDKGARGIVVEGTGRGNVSPRFFGGMERALRAGIPVVAVTRCSGGRVLDVYAYEGGVQRQKAAGVIMGGEISGQKARIKLMLALGVTSDRDRLAAYFDMP